MSDLQSKRLSEVINRTVKLTPGLSIVVYMNDYKEDLMKSLVQYDNVTYIFLTDNEMHFFNSVELTIDTQHIVLHAHNFSDLMNAALQSIHTTHVVFKELDEDLIINEEINFASDMNIILPRRTYNGEYDAYFNDIFKVTEETEASVKTLEKIVEVEAPAFYHPFAIKVDVELEVENNINELGIYDYPDELVINRLFAFNGIIFPSIMLKNHTCKHERWTIAKDIFLTEVLTSHSFTVSHTDKLTFDANVSALNSDLLNKLTVDEIYKVLSYYQQMNNFRLHPFVLQFLQHKVDVELLKLSNLLDQSKLSYPAVRRALKENKVKDFNLSVLNKGHARELVIAYCFPPYNDTSGNVMAKRIFEKGELVDVLYNNMDRIRSKDSSLLQITNDLMDTKFEMTAPQAFSSWGSIEAFTSEGIETYKQFQYKYDTLYSRAMFPASHFLAFEIKLLNKKMNWTAEFSDPLHTDVSSNVRYAPLDDETYLRRVTSLLPEAYAQLMDDNVFNVCELLPFAFADQLMFTNHLQLEYMIRRFSKEIQHSIRQRAIIKPHPTLPQPFYELEHSYYEVNDSSINLAYFGNFYDTRGFREIEIICKEWLLAGYDNFHIHIFTNLKPNVVARYNNSQFKEYMTLNPYVDYFEFLNLTNKLDGLIIFDAHTRGIKEVNPYLPSKLSDYLGSNAYTIAFTEEASILSEQQYDQLIKVNLIHYSKYAETLKTLSEKVKKPLIHESDVLATHTE